MRRRIIGSELLDSGWSLIEAILKCKCEPNWYSAGALNIGFWRTEIKSSCFTPGNNRMEKVSTNEDIYDTRF